MKPGESVLLRTVVQGRVREALPLVLVEETAERVALYCSPGTRNMRPTTGIRRGNFRSYEDGWEHEKDIWREHHVLWLAPHGEPYSLNLFWGPSWDFRGWYVQLQDPLRRSRLGFDTRDHALDVTVEPDGTWAWKDEDELARAVELRLFCDEEAAAIRAAGRRVIAERPWPTGWEEWRPDPAWAPPRLPEGWDVV